MDNGAGSLAAQVGQAGSITMNNSSGASSYIGSYIGGLLPMQSQMTAEQQKEYNDLLEKMQQITGSTFTFPIPPTKEELTELDALEQQRQRDMTQQQVDAFKKVPAAIRQRIVDDILWTRELNNIEKVDQTKSARQLELESKKSASHPYSISGTAGSGFTWSQGAIIGSTITTSSPFFAPVSRPVLPSRMTDEDIIQAHNEATMEEECLKQD
jgi:hypothetical protein